jgi:pimeloyl-ACP methyl ester carboxylesterase
VEARVRVCGTHRREMMGLPPTGKRIATSGIEGFRFEDGKMVEHWATFDALGMLRQIGMVRVPKPPLLARTLVHKPRSCSLSCARRTSRRDRLPNFIRNLTFLWSILIEVEVPALVGSSHRLVDRLTARLRTVEHHVLPDCGHSLHDDCPEQTYALLPPFLQLAT